MLGVLNKRDVDASEIWEEQQPGSNRVDTVCATMTYRRFTFLSRYICFDDFATRRSRSEKDPKFFKFREVVDRVKMKCQTSYEPGPHTCVDENLYPFCGRFRARQYMPKKPARYGIKMWQLVDSSSKYMFSFDV